MALRDEFYEAKPHKFSKEVKSVLITFGGTDQNNLTKVTLKNIYEICSDKNIKINIICGSGYLFKEELLKFIESLPYKNISCSFASGIISKVMEESEVAISSNGRTVYELADMNIPSIVICHHERENTHNFASLERGFLNLGIFNKDDSPSMIKQSFLKIVENSNYRELLFFNIEKFNFRNNKKKIVEKILSLLN
jgi:spore coat polysaccharide biosynthesis predicted glycosyltransferase SpsG